MRTLVSKVGKEVLAGIGVALALAAPASASMAERTVCVVAATEAIGEAWAKLLEPYRVRVRTLDGDDLSDLTHDPKSVRCEAMFATSDSALYWRSHPNTWREVAALPMFLMGAATELALPTGRGAENARFVPLAGQAVTLASGVSAQLELPASAPRDEGGALGLYRDDVSLRALAGVDPRRISGLEVLARTSGAADAEIVIARIGPRILWGFAGTPDSLTATGRAVLAGLVSSMVPGDSAVLGARAERPAPTPAAPRTDAHTARASSDDRDDSSESSQGFGDASRRASASLVPVAKAKRAPRLEFRDSFDGAPSSFDALNGRVSMVVFWATWCGWCKQEMPEIQNLADGLARKGVSVVAVSIDKQADAAGKYMRKGGFHIPTAVSVPGAQNQFGLNGVPSAALLDRSGRIRATYSGAGSFRLAKVTPAAEDLLANR